VYKNAGTTGCNLLIVGGKVFEKILKNFKRGFESVKNLVNRVAGEIISP